MNKGVLQSSSQLQQMNMAAGNPNWWNINNMRPPPLLQQPTIFPPYIPSPASATYSWQDQFHNQEHPDSWTQLLLSGLVDQEEEENRSNLSHLLIHQHPSNSSSFLEDDDDHKQDKSQNNFHLVHESNHENFQEPTWSPPPNSTVTSFKSNSMLDFTHTKVENRHSPPDRSSERGGTSIGGVVKKARVQTSLAQSTLKVRKEKLCDRITSLHQLVSPFGKTDTASVLLEAIGYIRFLQSQIEVLSLPYFASGAEDVQSLLHSESHGEQKKDLRSRGLCLVPVSSTIQVGSDNAADYWIPPALSGVSFR